MKKTIIIIACALVSTGVLACDVCGGASMNIGFGYIPLQKRHIIGLNYNFNSFQTTHPTMDGISGIESKDQFHSIDLWMRYFISNKWIAVANIPYRSNSIVSDHFNYSSKGLGDISVQLYYSVWQYGSSTSKTQARWLAGAGIKAPTASGKSSNEQNFVQNIQVGSNSWDYLFGSNFSLKHNKIGINQETNYSLNGVDNKDFKFGNLFKAKLTLFRQLSMKKSSTIPQIGLSYMQQSKDLIWAERNIERLYSGKEQLGLTIGADYYRKSFGIRLNTEIPLHYQLSEGLVKPKAMLNLQFLYFITPVKKKTNNE